MNKTETFSPIDAADVKTAEYDALKLTNEEYLKLACIGHPGGFSSIAQDNAWEALQRLERLGDGQQS